MLSLELVLFMMTIPAALLCGSFLMLLYHVHYLSSSLKLSRSRLESKVSEFSDITAKASAANQSHANVLVEIQDRLVVLDERLNRLDNSIKMGGTKQNAMFRN